MTLLFADGCDWGASADLTRKYHFGVNINSGVATSNITVTSGGRGGGNCIKVHKGSNSTIPTINRAVGSVSGDLVIAFALYVNTVDATMAFFHAYSGGTIQIFLELTTGGNIQARVNSSPTTGGTTYVSTVGYSISTWHWIELKIKISDTVGKIILKVDGTTGINQTNIDTAITAGSTTVTAVGFRSEGPGSTNGGDFLIDDLVILDDQGSVNNDFPGDTAIKTLLPNGNGNSSQLVGSDSNSTDNYLLVDETSLDTADYVGSATLNDIDLYAMTDLTGSPTIKAVCFSPVLGKADAGGRKYAPMVRQSTTNYAGSDTSVPLGPAVVQVIYETNPATSSAWTATEVNADEFGVKVRS